MFRSIFDGESELLLLNMKCKYFNWSNRLAESSIELRRGPFTYCMSYDSRDCFMWARFRNGTTN